MTQPCASHRRYLAAVADGETDLVPPAVLAHLEACAGCAEEVRLHAHLGESLRAALLPAPSSVPSRTAASRRPRSARSGMVARWPLAAGVAAAILLIVGGIAAGVRGHGGPDPVLVASTASLRQPALRSSDVKVIGAWCSRESDRREPPVDLPSLTPRGARSDSGSGAIVVTIFYTGATGGTVTVGWVDADAAPPAGTRAETRTLSGRTVIVVETAAGTAVVAGSVSLDVLWRTAGAVEAAVAS